LLFAGTLACWLVTVFPARWLGDDSAVLFSATAALLCFVPAAATLAWGEWALKGQPEQQLLAVLGGTGVRMAVVLAAGLALYFLHPEFHYLRFWIWVIVFYLVTLGLEVGILVSRSPAPDRPRHPEGTT
jgi:hypothetical protein